MEAVTSYQKSNTNTPHVRHLVLLQIQSAIYRDFTWKDKLTSYNGKAITYDESGNTLTYDGYTFTLEAGRQLAGISGNGQTISYKYNYSGYRTEKTLNGVTIKYYLDGDKIILENNGTDSVYYSYDADDKLISMTLNGTEYFYIRNGQGDITGLIDTSGTQVVSYTYDSWGKLISIDGSLKDTIGLQNPYRNRGYRYDSETGLYYLQSRYYNPEMGRYINADTTEILWLAAVSGEVLGANLFSYCANNPIMNVDSTGYWKIPTTSLGTLLAIIGISPIPSTLIAIGIYKLTIRLIAKYTLFIAKLGAFWGPVVQGALVAAAAITGIVILPPIAVGFFDAIVQRKKGVEITLKKNLVGNAIWH